MLICPLLSSCEKDVLSEGRRVGLFEQNWAFHIIEEQESAHPVSFGGQFGTI